MRSILPPFFTFAFVGTLAVVTVGTADVDDGFRVFTDKKGQKIEAVLLAVAPDWKMMKIRRKDGKVFATEIVKLSLDDQQFVKDWIKKQPAKTDYRLDISVDRKLIGTRKEKSQSGTYNYETKTYQAEITVKNLSREILPSPVLSYVLLRKEGVRFYKDSEGARSYSISPDEEVKDPVTIWGKETGQDLAYNRETVITTKPVEIDQLTSGSSELAYHDLFLGVMVQVRTQQGDLLVEYPPAGTSSNLVGITWDDALTFPRDPSDNPDQPGPDGANQAMAKGPSTHSLQKGDNIAGPVDLEKMPITLKGHVEPSSSSGNGTIIAVGGKKIGLALLMQNGELVGLQVSDSRRALVKARPPLGEFDVRLDLSESSLKLSIDGRQVAMNDSLGLFRRSRRAGIEVGFDKIPMVSEEEEPFAFPGKLEDVSVIIGP